MSTIKTNLIAVAAIAILTAPYISMANESALYPPSGGVIRLHNDPGGLITAYRDRFSQARDDGERVIIDGICLSACTLAVGILPHGRVCVTPKAVLGFAAAWTPAPGTNAANKEDRIPNAAATQTMMKLTRRCSNSGSASTVA